MLKLVYKRMSLMAIVHHENDVVTIIKSVAHHSDG